MEIQEEYDYVIIGSGFGGSVSALRLAEKGYSVLVIEKGKKYETKDFAKTNWNLRKWLWLPALKFFGIQKVSFFRHVSILSGVGVGGGSLVYANTLPKPKKAFFNQGSWANLADWEQELAPFYEKAWQMLGATQTPHLFESDLALQKVARQLHKESDFTPTKVAVYFNDKDASSKDPYFNGKGPERKPCTYCGACMTGCKVGAKNTLDKNYLYFAQKLGVQILPENEVIDILPVSEHGEDGYHITYKKSTVYFAKQKHVKCKGVIFAGGVLGTIPLLLKLKKTNLKKLSNLVGKLVRTNNESILLNTSYNRDTNFSEGVAIGSILELDEHSHLEPVRYGKGSGVWRLTMLPMVFEPVFWKRMLKLLLLPFSSFKNWLKVWFVKDYAKSTSMLLFMQHLESTLSFDLGFWGLKTKVDKGKAPSAFIKEAAEISQLHAKLSESKTQAIATEVITGIPSTAHILGGACMGETIEEGVINSKNEVFNYTNMYIFDGSMISANPGVNPSLTITAITERGMSLIPQK